MGSTFGLTISTLLLAEITFWDGVLWSLLAIFTIAFIVLLVLPWGKIKPMSKCVALSVYAHMLLGGYAIGTRSLFSGAEEEVAEELLPLQFVLESEYSESDEEEDHEPEDGADLNQVEPVPTENPGEQEKEPTPPEKTKEPDSISPDRIATAVPQDANSFSSSELLAQASSGLSPEIEMSSGESPLTPIDPASISPAVMSEPKAPSSGLDTILQSDLIERPLFASNQLDAFSNELEVGEAGGRPQQNRGGFHANDLKGFDPQNSIEAKLVELNQAGEVSWTQARARLSRSHQSLRVGDGKPLPELYALRDPNLRTLVLPLSGATMESEAAIERSLHWLSTCQSSDGRWDASDYGAGQEARIDGHDRQGAGAKADTAMTGLALLAFLGAGNTHLDGPYRDSVRKGLEFLLSQQKEDGSLAGDSEFYAQMYCHGIATFAMAEALAVTGDDRLRKAVDRAVAYTISAQSDRDGGWRYKAQDLGDMSQFGWQVMALVSAEHGDVAIPTRTWSRARQFLESSRTGTSRLLAGYKPGEKATATMTAEALWCRILLRESIDTQLLPEAIELIESEIDSPGTPNYYYLYYSAMTMNAARPESWGRWNAKVQQKLIAAQATQGIAAGSYLPDSKWGSYGGRVYSTALATLTLQAYYRYLPPSPTANVAEFPSANPLR